MTLRSLKGDDSFWEVRMALLQSLQWVPAADGLLGCSSGRRSGRIPPLEHSIVDLHLLNGKSFVEDRRAAASGLFELPYL
jgi:hypothetical protein